MAVIIADAVKRVPILPAAMAAILIAVKVEEDLLLPESHTYIKHKPEHFSSTANNPPQLKTLSEIIKATHKVAMTDFKKKTYSEPLSPQQIYDYKESVMTMEMLILRGIGFDARIEGSLGAMYSYFYILNLLPSASVDCNDSQEITQIKRSICQRALNNLNDRYKI